MTSRPTPVVQPPPAEQTTSDMNDTNDFSKIDDELPSEISSQYLCGATTLLIGVIEGFYY